MIQRKQLLYAIKDGVATSIANVESGLKCGCVCPSCGELLVAKKGAKRMHHFAHYSGRSCAYGYETSLHIAAKEILSKANRMMLPAVYIQFPNSPKASELYCEAKEIEVESVVLEQRFQDVIPDVVICAGGKQLFLGQHRTIAEASAVESPIRQETIGFPAHFFARAHNFKPPGRACQPEADSPMRT